MCPLCLFPVPAPSYAVADATYKKIANNRKCGGNQLIVDSKRNTDGDCKWACSWYNGFNGNGKKCTHYAYWPVNGSQPNAMKKTCRLYTGCNQSNISSGNNNLFVKGMPSLHVIMKGKAHRSGDFTKFRICMKAPWPSCPSHTFVKGLWSEADWGSRPGVALADGCGGMASKTFSPSGGC